MYLVSSRRSKQLTGQSEEAALTEEGLFALCCGLSKEQELQKAMNMVCSPILSHVVYLIYPRHSTKLYFLGMLKSCVFKNYFVLFDLSF